MVGSNSTSCCVIRFFCTRGFLFAANKHGTSATIFFFDMNCAVGRCLAEGADMIFSGRRISFVSFYSEIFDLELLCHRDLPCYELELKLQLDVLLHSVTSISPR